MAMLWEWSTEYPPQDHLVGLEQGFRTFVKT